MPDYKPKHKLAAQLYELYAADANADNAPIMEAYMKGVAPFFGIKTTERREILKHFLAVNKLPVGKELDELVLDFFACPQREMHYAAMETLQKQHKLWQGDELLLFEKLLQTKPWWDTVDVIAVKLVAPWFLKFPEGRDAVVRRWMKAPDMWTRRTAIIFQNPYKKKTDKALLFETILTNKKDKDFFRRKGIGWALREYAKTAPEVVKDFVEDTELSPLSKREALKHLG